MERAGHHRSAPDERLVGIDEEPDRHDLESERVQRLELLAVLRGGAIGDAGEHRDRRPVDVGVEDDRPWRRAREAGRDVHGDRALADPRLADEDDVLHPRRELSLRLGAERTCAPQEISRLLKIGALKEAVCVLLTRSCLSA